MAERLTRKELGAVTQAAEGLSNKAIANRVGRSERTIETHLSKAYAKLGIHSRDEAAAALSSYLEGKTSVAERVEYPASPSGPATAEPLGETVDSRPWLARQWRPLPRSRLAILGLVLGSALIVAILIAAILANVEVIVRGIERLSRLSSGDVS